MNTRLAVIAGAATVTLVALGGTALALSSGAPAPAPGAPAAVVAATTTSTTTAPLEAAPTPQQSGAELSADEAAAIALERVGGGRVDEIEREFEHGRNEWKVEVVHAGAEHDVRVDALTGAITRYELDDVSGGDRDRSDRGHY